MKVTRLNIDEVADLPLLEVSGIGQRRDPVAGRPDMLAVGDDNFTIVVTKVQDLLDADIDEYEVAEYDVEKVIRSAGAEHGSEWEAADGDSTGRVFVLQESPGKVFVLSPDFQELLHTIELSLDSTAGKRLDWRAEPNAQGEGLVLLANGHLLVAKEKDPCLLLEFGPADERAAGFAPELALVDGAEFPTPKGVGSGFEVLKVWDFEDDAAAHLSDISDIATGPDRRFYLLSDESRCIVRLNERGEPGAGKCGADVVWELPEEIDQPEGLIVTDKLVPIVAIDTDEAADNLFIMEPLERGRA